MARNKSGYSVGEAPPQVLWTVVRGDTSAFKVLVTDDLRVPLNIPDWQIAMQVRRPVTPGIISETAELILTLYPEQDENDEVGEFTVSLAASESQILTTGDVFDIELSLPQDQIVWTVAQGTFKIIEDVTNG